MSFIFKRAFSILAAVACVLFVAVSGPIQVQAASADAWAEYQQEVEQACRSAANASFMVRVALVDPYGSDSYGYALLIGLEPSATVESIVVCAYDVASKKAEISGAFAL